MFIGYLFNFKEWYFFNLDTKKEVINNSAIFDKRVYSESFKINIDLYVPGLIESINLVREFSELYLLKLPAILKISQNP